jgi:hypothetical protein
MIEALSIAPMALASASTAVMIKMLINPSLPGRRV